MDLFDQASQKHEESPLAARMRPRNLDEYIGQDHIVGKGRLLRRAIAADQLTSVIFYGPPGTGKTTLARVIANHTKSDFITLNAVLTGVADIRNAIKQAEERRKMYGRRTILFVDEVHRWNKSQQDALLPWVENGTIILIGATTENPFFEVNRALVSRSRVFQLKALTQDDLKKAALNALGDKERGYGKWKVVFEDGALEHLIETANGDARSLLNALELAVETTPEVWKPDANPPEPPLGSEIFISMEAAEESIQKKVVLYDKDGDYHSDIISAFIKSLRGRDPDAAMYWMARMIRAGEDPHFIFRRMLISSCEDTGLADPNAISVVESCAQAFDRVGMPEGRYFLAHAALYLATAPKSNSSMAFFDALRSVETEDAEVPNHLKDASRDTEGFGHGAGYLYPHAYRDHWVAQQYLPDALIGRVFYTPTDQGYEATIRSDVLSRRELQIAAMLEDDENDDNNWNPDAAQRSATAKSCATSSNATGANEIVNPIDKMWHASRIHHGDIKTGENLTFSPGGEKRNEWQRRLDSGKAEALLEIRNSAIEMADIKRHFRCLVIGADDGLFLWELWRKTPEGFVAGICKTERGKQVLEQYGKTLDMIERPLLVMKLEELVDIDFDFIFFKDAVGGKCEFENFSKVIEELKNRFPKATFVFAQKIPGENQRLSSLLRQARHENTNETLVLLDEIEQGENEFFAQQEDFNWTEKDFLELVRGEQKDKFHASDTQKSAPRATTKVISEKRKFNDNDIDRWFSTNSRYGAYLTEKLGSEKINAFTTLLKTESKNREWNWNSVYAFVKL
ncbi:MAG: AAA family ATPase [Spirochaetales bacterium]|nr:AAA family ATPase [Spirochaetales bacterium]